MTPFELLGAIVVGIIAVVISFFVGRFQKEWEFDRLKKTLRDEKYLDGQLDAFHIVGREYGVIMRDASEIAMILSDFTAQKLDAAAVDRCQSLTDNITATYKSSIIKQFQELMFISGPIVNRIKDVETRLTKANVEWMNIWLKGADKPITLDDIKKFDKVYGEVKDKIIVLSAEWRKQMEFED